MKNYYDGAYSSRLNRYGYDHQSRILGQREKVFQQYLLKSIYRVEFEHDGEYYVGSLERYQQDETKMLQYLLVDLQTTFAPGTILNIPDQSQVECFWMVYWLEESQAKGYNKYVVLRMSHLISWLDRDGNTQEAYAYFYGPESSIKESIKSQSGNAVYSENTSTYSFITSLNENINIDDYFEVVVSDDENSVTGAYVVKGYDVQSTLGVEYVLVDPVYQRDLTPAPTKQTGDKDEDFYWLENGGSN